MFSNNCSMWCDVQQARNLCYVRGGSISKHLWDKMHLCSGIKQSSHHKSFRGSKRCLCRRAPSRATAHQPSPAKSVIMCSLLFAKMKMTYWSRMKELCKILCEDLWLKLVWPPISVVATQDPTACADHRRKKAGGSSKRQQFFKIWTRTSHGEAHLLPDINVWVAKRMRKLWS